MFSAAHLIDWANVHFLISPVGIPLILLILFTVYHFSITIFDRQNDKDYPFGALFIVQVLDTRESPGSLKGNQEIAKFKPTSCELFKNEGAEGFVPDATFENGFLNDVPVVATVTPFSTGLTDQLPVTVVDPNDLDCDGVPNAEDFCPGSDPINFGPIDDWGCDTTQTDLS